MSGRRHSRDVEWDTVPGFISILNLLYNVTEYFEFAARLAQAGIYEGAVTVRIELHGVKGFVLTPESDRSWGLYCVASENLLEKSWAIPSDKLVADTSGHSLAATAWFLESFGWREPNLAVLQKDQEKFLRRSS